MFSHITIIVNTHITHNKNKNLNSPTHLNYPFIRGSNPLKPYNNVINTISKSTMNENSSSKVKRPICSIQIWAPSLIVYVHSFHSSTKCELSLKNNLNYFLLFNYMNTHFGLSCALWGKHFLIDIFSNGNMKHPICQLLEHWLQINTIATLVNFSHNIQKK
jgi:hypothetical protein